MTYLEIHKSIAEITREKCNECKARLDNVPKENATERKALQLEYGMYSFCRNCGLLGNTDGSGPVTLRKRVLEGVMNKYPVLCAFYDSLDDEDKLRFIAGTQAELFIRDQWLPAQYAELEAAEATGNTQNTFELKIKIGSVINMFDTWEAWRVENNVFPGVFKEGLR